jgi:hypothetical protein
MPNTTKQDSAPEPAETTATPLPPVSQSSAGQPSSDGSKEAAALYKKAVDEAKASLREEFKRELGEAKSTKDRAISNLTEKLTRYDQLLDHYKDPDEAKWRMKVEDTILEKETSGRSSPVVDTGTVKQAGLEERARGVLAKSKLTDPTEQLEIMQGWAQSAPPGGYSNDDDAIAGIADFIADFKIAKSKRDAPVSAASASAPTGGSVTETDATKLMKQYQKDITPWRGNIQKVSLIQSEYRKKGLNV